MEKLLFSYFWLLVRYFRVDPQSDFWATFSLLCISGASGSVGPFAPHKWKMISVAVNPARCISMILVCSHLPQSSWSPTNDGHSVHTLPIQVWCGWWQREGQSIKQSERWARTKYQSRQSRAAKRRGFKREGFPIWSCPSLLVLFCSFLAVLGLSRFLRDFPDLLRDGPGIFPIRPFSSFSAY